MTRQTTTIKIDPYSSSTGAGTLSYYARKYGTSVDNLVKLNPSIHLSIRRRIYWVLQVPVEW
jgi:hypothetical protein